MSQNAFYNLFVDTLRDLFDGENQIVQKLPKVIQSCTNAELKDALSQHLDETKNQVQRLKKIFKALNENPTGKTCKTMECLFDCGEDFIAQKEPKIIQDVGLIIDCQKVEHYEIACYGSARALARHLSDSAADDRIDFDAIADLLQETLDEESAADEKLTDIAEGGFFSQGLNEEAQRAEPAVHSSEKTSKVSSARSQKQSPKNERR